MDDFTRAVWLYLLVDKKEVAQTIKYFCAMVKRQFSKCVQTVRSDNGTEFMFFRSYFTTQ